MVQVGTVKYTRYYKKKSVLYFFTTIFKGYYPIQYTRFTITDRNYSSLNIFDNLKCTTFYRHDGSVSSSSTKNLENSKIYGL